MKTAFVGRQPILSVDGDIFAYELLFRTNLTNSAIVESDAAATANVLLNSVNYIGLEKLIGSKKAFVNVDKEFLLGGAVEAAPKGKFVIEILENVAIDDEVTAKVRALKEKGYTFAIDDFDLSDAAIKNIEPILEYIDFLKVDLKSCGGTQGIAANSSFLGSVNAVLLAEKVESKAEFEACAKSGFTLYQGNFFEEPQIVEGKKLDASKNRAVRLLKMLKNGSEIDAIAEEISKSARLSINLLRYINSACIGLKCKVGSIPQAVSLMGKDPLFRWLMLFLYAGVEDNKFISPLLESAILRANIMSGFAKKISKDKTMMDKAYLTGLLSFFDAIIQIPLEKIKEEIAVDDEIFEAITTKKQFLGNLLVIAELTEKGDMNQLEKIMGKLGIKMPDLVEMLGFCYASANASRN